MTCLIRERLRITEESGVAQDSIQEVPVGEPMSVNSAGKSALLYSEREKC